MLKILQARLQQYVKCDLPDVQAGFRKGRGNRDLITNIHWIMEKAREFQKKHIFLSYWLCQSLWLCGSQQSVENSPRYENIRPPGLPPEKSPCRSRSNSWYWTWNSRLVPNRKRSMSSLYIVTLLIQLTCRVHHEKCQAGWSTSWNQDCCTLRNSDMQITPTLR